MGNSTKLETKDEIGRTADDNRKMDSTDQSLLNEAHDTNTVDVSSDTIPSTPPNNNSELETTINESKEIPLCSKDVCHISAIEITSQGNGGERKEMTEVMQADAENNKPDDLKNCVTDLTDSQFFMFDNDMDDSLDR